MAACRHGRPGRARPAAGFGLLEVLITMVILAGGLLAIGGMYVKIMRESGVSRQRIEALTLAQTKLEELRAQAFSTLTSASDTVAASAVAGRSADYQRSWSISSFTSPATYKAVTVTVTWADSQGQTQSAAVSSRIGNVGSTALVIP